MVTFDSFVSKAYELAPQGVGSKGGSSKVGLLGDRVVKVGFFDRWKVNVAETKRQFVESALAQFGPGVDKVKMRAEIEKMVEGGKKTPLSARMIISVSEFVGENTSTINRLSSILNRAATNDFRMVSITDVGRIFTTDLENKGVKDVSTRRSTIMNLQREAELAMTRVLSYTGRQIGEAMAGKGDQTVRDNIDKAVSALCKIGNELHIIDRQATVDIPGLAEVRDLAYSRATELNRIANELGALCADETPAKDKEAMLNATAGRLMAGVSLEMHGTEQALSLIEQNLRPLLDRVDAIKSGVSGGGISWDTTALLRDLTAAKDAFDGAARNGIDVSPDKSGKEVLRPNPTLFAEVGRLLDKAIADVTAVAQDQAKVVVTSAVQEICPNLKSTSLMRDFPSLADGLTGSFHVKMLAGLMDVVRASATTYAQSQDPSMPIKPLYDAVGMVTSYCKANYAHLQAFLREVEVKAKDESATGPNEAQRKALKDFQATSFGSGLGTFYLMMKKLPDRCEALCNMAKGAPLAASLKNDGLLKLALEGRIDIPTLTGARGWGATEDMVDVNISDANLVETKPLGHGAFNQVVLCKYRQPDGTMKSYVFKSEISGEQGFPDSCGMCEGYSQLQSIVHLNAATRKIGELLGTPEVCVDAKVGCLNGRFGLFMELAPGQSVSDMLDKPGKDYGDAAKGKIGALTPGQKTVLRGKMMRATVDLAWNDWLSGQGDRHFGNFLFNVGGDQSFSLKGVDNDMSFSTWRLGMTKFRLVGRHLDVFLEKLAEQRLIGMPPKVDALRAISGSGAVDIDKDGSSVTVDLSKAAFMSQAVRAATGFQSLHKPMYISRSMYQHLKQLAADPTQLDRILGPHVPPEAIDVVKLRLNEMVVHADRLARQKRVLSDEEWMDESFQQKYDREGQSVPMWTQINGSIPWAFKSHYANSLGAYYKDQLGFPAA